jgi:OTU domain-containing protein 3
VGTAEAGSAVSLIGAAGGAGGVDCGTPPSPLLQSPGMNVDVDVDVVDADVDIDIDVVDVEMDADMPGLTTSSVGDSSSSSLSSSPLSSSPMSSEAGSEAWSASASPAPEPEGEEVDMDPTTPVAASKTYPNGLKTSNPPPSSMNKPKRFPHPYEAGGGGVEKQLTRRQRKALGLPKQRNVPPYLASGAKGASASAGKIVIPGGRWTGRASSASATAIPGVADPDPSGVEEEWRRNGTGRVDVRGFRELKI